MSVVPSIMALMPFAAATAGNGDADRGELFHVGFGHLLCNRQNGGGTLDNDVSGQGRAGHEHADKRQYHDKKILFLSMYAS